MNNIIKKCYKNNGDESTLDSCDYLQLQLLGSHAESNDAVVLISKKCLNLVLSFKWYLGKGGYPIAYGSNNDMKINVGKGIKLHQLLYNRFSETRPLGTIVGGYVIDHINRNKLDNRLENLRMCSQKQNSYNTSRRRKDKFKGVSKNKNSWCSRITKDGQTYVIKNIASEEEAAKIYDLMAEDLFGQYAGKNYN